jgi:hypothetical protein
VNEEAQKRREWEKEVRWKALHQMGYQSLRNFRAAGFAA